MASLGAAPRFLGSVAERVHACELEVYCHALTELHLLRDLTPEQRKLRDQLRVVLAVFQVPFV